MKSIKIKIVCAILLTLSLSSCGMVPEGVDLGWGNKSQSTADNSTSQVQADAQVNLTNGESKAEKYRNSNVDRKEKKTSNSTDADSGDVKIMGTGDDKSKKEVNTKIDNSQKDKKVDIRKMDTLDLGLIVGGIIITALLAGIVFGKMIPTRLQTRTYKLLLKKVLEDVSK